MEKVAIDMAKVRTDFPILKREVYGKPLVYLDNAATSQKPQVVIDAITEYYSTINSNVHRGVHHLSQVATDRFEEVRRKVKEFIGAAHEHEVIFTRGTTESINLVAYSFGQLLKEGELILVSQLEHHSNFVPWQMLAERKKLRLRFIPMNEVGELDQEAFAELLNEKPRLVAFNHVSNSLGTIHPVKEMIEKAHAAGAVVVLDGAQAVAHMPINVQELDADFYAFSAHKMCGPTGLGVLYGKEKWLNAMPPFMGGGEMIKEVKTEGSTWADLPHKFEAGTPNIAEVMAMGAAIDYLRQIGWETIDAQEQELLKYATNRLNALPGMRIFGSSRDKVSVISFLLEGIHPYDAGMVLDKLGIAVRTGHHCTQPVMDYFQIPGTVRASFAFYNTKEEVDALISGLERVIKMFRG
jgi:cysteine desulfurase / selenocysteine lyase